MKKVKMNDNKIIYRPVFGIRGFALAEFTPRDAELIGLADCLHLESVKITCFGFFGATTFYLKRYFRENEIDDLLLNISTFRRGSEYG